jgi:hypothetical protein
MANLDWSQCPAVESVPGKRSGAWVFNIPLYFLRATLEAGIRMATDTRISAINEHKTGQPRASCP